MEMEKMDISKKEIEDRGGRILAQTDVLSRLVREQLTRKEKKVEIMWRFSDLKDTFRHLLLDLTQ